MQKKLKLLFIVANLFIAASVVFIACGEGTPILVEDVKGNVDLAGEYLTAPSNMSSAVENALKSSSEEPPPSSGGQQQSSSGGVNPPPSSGGQQQSSSGGVNPPPSSGGQQQSSSSVQKSSSSARPTVAGCGESNPEPNFQCGWNVTGTLVPGTMLKPKDYTLPSGCTNVVWKYAPSTSAMALKNECSEIEDPAGFPALGSKVYVLFAELTCGSDKRTTACEPKTGLSSKQAPVLEGKCEWPKNPTTTARGGIPSGVTAKDVDGVCPGGPSVVYKYDDGDKDWPKTGILPEWSTGVWKDDKKHKETYSVEAVLQCKDYPDKIASACDPLEVSSGTDYIIECTGKFDDKSCKVGSTVGNSVVLGLNECVEINVVEYTDQYNLPNVIMRCETQGTAASASVTLSLNGEPTTASGSWSVQPIIQLGKIKLGNNELGTLCLTEISGATGVKCTGPAQ